MIAVLAAVSRGVDYAIGAYLERCRRIDARERQRRYARAMR